MFLDLKLAEINGKSILKTIKDEAKDTVIVLVTGDTADQTAIKALQYGPMMLVKKPYKEKDIVEVLNMLIKGKNI